MAKTVAGIIIGKFTKKARMPFPFIPSSFWYLAVQKATNTVQRETKREKAILKSVS